MRSSGRQSQPVFQEPQQRLSNGGESGEFGEDQRDRFLNATIRVLLELWLISLHVTDPSWM
jgi:hypothetical protein